MWLLSPNGHIVEAGSKYCHADGVGRRLPSAGRVVLDQAAKDSAKCPVEGGVGRKVVSGGHGGAAAKDSQGSGSLEIECPKAVQQTPFYEDEWSF